MTHFDEGLGGPLSSDSTPGEEVDVSPDPLQTRVFPDDRDRGTRDYEGRDWGSPHQEWRVRRPHTHGRYIGGSRFNSGTRCTSEVGVYTDTRSIVIDGAPVYGG